MAYTTTNDASVRKSPRRPERKEGRGRRILVTEHVCGMPRCYVTSWGDVKIYLQMAGQRKDSTYMERDKAMGFLRSLTGARMTQRQVYHRKVHLSMMTHEGFIPWVPWITCRLLYQSPPSPKQLLTAQVGLREGPPLSCDFLYLVFGDLLSPVSLIYFLSYMCLPSPSSRDCFNCRWSVNTTPGRWEYFSHAWPCASSSLPVRHRVVMFFIINQGVKLGLFSEF